MTDQAGKSGAYYRMFYKGVLADPYRILDLYQITHPAHQHAIKKLLRAGKSVKPLITDIQESIDALERFKQMIQEDNKNE